MRYIMGIDISVSAGFEVRNLGSTKEALHNLVVLPQLSFGVFLVFFLLPFFEKFRGPFLFAHQLLYCIFGTVYIKQRK